MIPMMSIYCLILIGIFGCFRCAEGNINVWQSGVINFDDFDNGNVGFLESIFGSICQDNCDNFVFAILPLKRQERVLFVTPQILKRNFEAVKETFIRFQCDLIGILMGRKEITWMTRGTIFNLLPSESREKLKICLQEFEMKLNFKLRMAMIDLGSDDDFILEFKNEFKRRNILLFKHPMNIVNGQIYFNSDTTSESEYFNQDFSIWSQKRFNQSIPGPFKVYRTYQLRLPLCEDAILKENEKRIKLNCEIEDYISKKMEMEFGEFEEIPLEQEQEEVEKFITKCEDFNADFSVDEYDDSDYEFV